MPPARIQAERLDASGPAERGGAAISLAGGQMLYRGDDQRRLVRLGDIADRAFVPLIAVNDVSLSRA